MLKVLPVLVPVLHWALPWPGVLAHEWALLLKVLLVLVLVLVWPLLLGLGGGPHERPLALDGPQKKGAHDGLRALDCSLPQPGAAALEGVRVLQGPQRGLLALQVGSPPEPVVHHHHHQPPPHPCCGCQGLPLAH